MASELFKAALRAGLTSDDEEGQVDLGEIIHRIGHREGVAVPPTRAETLAAVLAVHPRARFVAGAGSRASSPRGRCQHLRWKNGREIVFGATILFVTEGSIETLACLQKFRTIVDLIDPDLETASAGYAAQFSCCFAIAQVKAGDARFVDFRFYGAVKVLLQLLPVVDRFFKIGTVRSDIHQDGLVVAAPSVPNGPVYLGPYVTWNTSPCFPSLSLEMAAVTLVAQGVPFPIHRSPVSYRQDGLPQDLGLRGFLHSLAESGRLQEPFEVGWCGVLHDDCEFDGRLRKLFEVFFRINA